MVQISNKYKIANYYGLNYKIYDDGTIIGPQRGKIKQRENSDGYMEVTLGTLDNRHAGVRVHRIVAEQFLPNPLNLPEVNHKDYDRKNNCVDNLEWVTHNQNVSYSVDAGHYNGCKGEKNGRAKISWNDVDCIRELYNSGTRIYQIAKEFNLPYSTVFNIVKYKTWK